jgi:hypothetical protein
VNGLQASGFGNKRGQTDPENAYQLRVAGYPERVIPISSANPGGRKAVAADGMRTSDGYMVDAKYVKDNGKNCYRIADTFDVEQEYKPDGSLKWHPSNKLVQDDRDEMDKYRQAVEQYDQVRGLEIDTNYPSSVAYWQTLMAESGVPGVARYVP